MKKNFICLLAIIITNQISTAGQNSIPQENGQILLADSFDAPSDGWKPIYLQHSQGGSFSIADGKLVIKAEKPDCVFGVYNTEPIEGHFYIEADFQEDNFCGLGLMQIKNGRPDANNFTSIFVHKNNSGLVAVSLKDRQNGIDDILDNTGTIGKKRYEHILTGQNYSVPFDCTNKKFRIFYDAPAGFFHLYYSVGKEIKGKWAQDWLEVAPSKNWADKSQKYCVVLYCCSEKAATAEAVFKNIKVVQKPTCDKNDAETGFKAVFRDYNWSGFFGNALVVTFGDDFDFYKNDCKFVFWSQANYVPVWHLNNQLLYSYEFIETWGLGDRKVNPGCYEPMSDRLLRWSNVEIIQDNDVRKIIKWHYALCNPDYKVPNDWQGTQIPEADEYWTFYPDGTGIRQIIYKPKLDCDFLNANELTELIVIAGSLSNPNEHLASPALTVLDMEDDLFTYHPANNFNQDINGWKQVIMAGHFKNAPDAFNVFADAEDVPDTYCHYKIDYQLTWHNTVYKMCHWPVGKEPFGLMDKTFGTFKSQVSHSSLMGAGVYGGSQWKDHYKTDSDGRKYRQWLSLVGLSEPGCNECLRIKAASWLYPGKIKMLNKDAQFEKINYARKEFVFSILQNNEKHLCNFILEPAEKFTTVNPVFKINNWGQNTVKIESNGRKLIENRDFKYAFENDAIIIWIKKLFDSNTEFKISSE